MKIETLTKEQIARQADFRDRWLKIGLSTEPADRETAEAGIHLAYKFAGIKQPDRIVWCSSPIGNALTRAIVFQTKISKSNKASVRDSVGASVRDSVRASVQDSVGASVWASVRDSVRASVRDSVRASVQDSVGASVWDSVQDSVGASVWDSVWDSVRASVQDSVGASVWDSVQASVRDSVRDSSYGQHDANWLAFYDYFRDVCQLEKQTEKIGGLWMIAKSAGWFIPHERICWVSERHNVLHLNSAGKLHKDGAAALAYPDGWCIYALNGVRIANPEYVLTPASKLAPETVLGETNAQVRAELIRKVGIERMLAKLSHKILEKVGNYELLDVKLSDQIPHARYLKMLNPSVGVWHMEGVEVECDTVQKAINWRAGDINKNWSPAVLT